MKKFLLSLVLASVSSVCFAQGEIAPIAIPADVSAGFRASCADEVKAMQQFNFASSADAGKQFSRDLEACLARVEDSYRSVLLSVLKSAEPTVLFSEALAEPVMPIAEPVMTTEPILSPEPTFSPVITPELLAKAAEVVKEVEMSSALSFRDGAFDLLSRSRKSMCEADKSQLEQLRQEGDDEKAQSLLKIATENYLEEKLVFALGLPSGTDLQSENVPPLPQDGGVKEADVTDAIKDIIVAQDIGVDILSTLSPEVKAAVEKLIEDLVRKEKEKTKEEMLRKIQEIN